VTLWKNVHIAVPTNGQDCWFVRIPFFDTPVLGTYRNLGVSIPGFDWTDSNGDAQVTTVYQVFKWRPT